MSSRCVVHIITGEAKPSAAPFPALASFLSRSSRSSRSAQELGNCPNAAPVRFLLLLLQAEIDPGAYQLRFGHAGGRSARFKRLFCPAVMKICSVHLVHGKSSMTYTYAMCSPHRKQEIGDPYAVEHDFRVCSASRKHCGTILSCSTIASHSNVIFVMPWSCKRTCQISRAPQAMRRAEAHRVIQDLILALQQFGVSRAV